MGPPSTLERVTTRMAACLAFVPGVLVLVLPAQACRDSARPADPPVESRTAGERVSRAPDPVRVELRSTVAIIMSGSRFDLGILLDAAPGWHVTWRNPGDAGNPTTVAFDLPEGFVAGPLRWPVPERFTRPDGGIGYGYAGEVLLRTRVRASNLDPPNDWRLAADVGWEACADVCVQGRASLERYLPPSISGTRLPDLVNGPLFEAWADQYPVAKLQAASQVGITRLPADTEAPDPGSVIVAFDWAFQPTRVEWFPYSPTAAAYESASLDTDGSRTLLRLVTASPATGESGLLEGVLAYDDVHGMRRGLEISVPLEAGPVP